MNEVEFVRGLRHRSTDAERLLWLALRRRQRCGFKFRRQAPIGTYFADFASYDAGVIVEVDGEQHCAASRDVIRDTWLVNAGWEVVRYWNPDVMNNLAGVVADIDERLRGQLPHCLNRGRGCRVLADGNSYAFWPAEGLSPKNHG